MSDSVKNLSIALLSLRLLAGMTVEDVVVKAEGSGLKPKYVEQWENGDTVPSFENLIWILDVYGRDFIALEVMLWLIEEVKQVRKIRGGLGEVPTELSVEDRMILAYSDASPDSALGRWLFGEIETMKLSERISGSTAGAVTRFVETIHSSDSKGTDGNA